MNKIEDGILYKTKCYEIGSIEHGNGRSWREHVTEELSQLGIICYDPFKKPFIKDTDETEEYQKDLVRWRENGEFDKLSKHMRKIRNHDLALVDKCDFIICHLNIKTPTCGTFEELFTANRAKKVIFLSCEQGVKSLYTWLFGTLNHHYFYNSVDEIIDMIKKINSGECEVDSDRWKLLKPCFR